MRWLVVHPGPSWSVADVHNGITEALTSIGEQVVVYDLDKRLQFFDAAYLDIGDSDEHGNPAFRKACTREQAAGMAAESLRAVAFDWWPDVVLAVSAFFIPVPLLDVLRDRGMKVILWHTESPYQDAEQLERAPHADASIVNDPASLDAYQRYGTAEYFPHCYRPGIHHPGPGRPELKSDLAFVGTGFASRRRFFEAMNLDGLDVLLAGTWAGVEEGSRLWQFLADPRMGAGLSAVKSLDNDQAADVYRSARAGINLYRREGEESFTPGVAMGPREVEMAACGLFFLRDPRPEGDALLPMLPAFTGPEDAGEQLRWWLAHDGARDKAATAARAAVADRTFENAARRLLRLAGKL